MRGLLGRRIDRLVQDAAETIGRRLEQATRGAEGAVQEACASQRERLARLVGVAQRWRSEL